MKGPTDRGDRPPCFDIVVVGSGCAGLMAANAALWTDPACSVLVIEKEQSLGGTTFKSGGVIWLPNNVLMPEGKDDRQTTVQLLARYAFPDRYNPALPFLGLDQLDFEHICQMYDLGRPVSERLQQIAFQFQQFRDKDDEMVYEFQYSPIKQPENVAPQGRLLGVGMPFIERTFISFFLGILACLLPILVWLSTWSKVARDLAFLARFSVRLDYGPGPYLVKALLRGLTHSEGVTIWKETAVEDVILNETGSRIIGVRARQGDKVSEVYSRRGVIFASGGFSHNPKLLHENVIESPRMPHGKYVSRTGASKGNNGAFLNICEKIGAELSDLDFVWGCETMFLGENPPRDLFEMTTPMFYLQGDAFFVVGPHGTRVYNEKLPYDARSRCHWTLPEGSCEMYKTGVLFLIGDEQCLRDFGTSVVATWPVDMEDPLLIKGTSMEDLGKKIQERYPEYVNQSVFGANLVNTTRVFNDYARTGVDVDFGRGTTAPYETQWTTKPLPKGCCRKTNNYPNVCMRPLNAHGPYYALAIVAALLDTKGGPRVDLNQRVLRSGNRSPFQGLYACGNCSRSLSGDCYLTGGLTLGACLVNGYVAGTRCAADVNTSGTTSPNEISIV